MIVMMVIKRMMIIVLNEKHRDTKDSEDKANSSKGLDDERSGNNN